MDAQQQEQKPKVGVGIMILNEDDEVIVSQRTKIGGPLYMKWQFPSGYLEQYEQFSECISRELVEECGEQAYIEPKDIKYLATINIVSPEHSHHNVGIVMVTI